MTQFSAILVGNESLTRHAAETLLARGHRIKAIVTRSPELRDWAAGAGLRVEDQDAPVPADAPQFVRDYHAYYKTSRGYHARSLNSTQGWNATSNLAFLNAPILAYAAEIRSAVMVVHGEKAHSRYMGEDAFKKLQGDNKRLLIVPGANHTDLYDKMEIIPFDEIAAFYREYLK